MSGRRVGPFQRFNRLGCGRGEHPETVVLPRVMFVPFTGLRVPENLPLLKWNHQAVWDNVERNRLVGELATGFTVRPGETLRKFGVTAKGVRLPAGVRPRVTTLVETVEHARRAARRLTNWGVADALPLPPAVERGRAGPHGCDRETTRVIATLMHAVRNGIDADVLVRATAGTGKLNWSCIRNGSGQPGTTPPTYRPPASASLL